MQVMHRWPVSRISTQPVRDSNGHLLPSFKILFLYPQTPTPPARSAYPHHVPLPQIPDFNTHEHKKHTVCQNIALTNAHKHKTYCPSEHLTQQNTRPQNTLSVRTSHSLTHTNTKHIVHQNISLNKIHTHKTHGLSGHHPSGHLTITHKHNPYCPSEPTTGR